jgi:5-oxoprolinase (ATP-hydrolysing) subunit B
VAILQMTPVLPQRRVGESGLMVDLPSVREARHRRAWIRDQTWADELDELIPGAKTIYLQGSQSTLDVASRALSSLELKSDDSQSTGRQHVLAVRYDGPDLPRVAQQTGLTPDEVVQLHQSVHFTVHFFGFSPGQAFFAGVPETLRIPRLQTPRTRVPSGSVGIANEYTVIYPRNSPGGWSLIGTYVGHPLWVDCATPPNIVDVGDTIIFKDADA